MQIQIKMKPVPPVGSSFPPTSRVYHRESVRNDGSDDDWDDDYYWKEEFFLGLDIATKWLIETPDVVIYSS